MLTILNFLKALRGDERGVSALEYAVLAGLIIVVAIAGITALGTQIDALFSGVAEALPDASSGG